MKVRLRTLMAGPDGIFHAGSVIDRPAEEAEALVAAGYAERLERLPETGAVQAGTRAVRPASRPRKAP